MARTDEPAPEPGRLARSREGGGADEMAVPLNAILEELRGLRADLRRLGERLDAGTRRGDEPPGMREPGSVPPGVAVETPAALKEEDRAVLERLEHGLPESSRQRGGDGPR